MVTTGQELLWNILDSYLNTGDYDDNLDGFVSVTRALTSDDATDFIVWFEPSELNSESRPAHFTMHQGHQWGGAVRPGGYYLAADGYGDETLWRRDPTGRGNGTPLLAERQMPHDVWQHFIVGTLRDTDAADKRRKDKQEDDS